MERVIIGLWMVLALSGPGSCLAAEDPVYEPPVHRYLIVVEASSSMARRKEVALDTVHQLILSGLYGRIQRGDVLGIWPFKNQVDRKLSRPIHWSARESRDFANFIYRKLRDLEFAKEPDLNTALAAVSAEALRSQQLTVFLVTTGVQPVRGTPFDAEINAIFKQHGDGLNQAKRPFVSVLVFDGGQVVAQAVTPGGRTIYIPPVPGTVAAAAPVKPEVEPIVPPEAPARVPMTVEEISAKLREAQAPPPSDSEVESAGATPPPATPPTPELEPDTEPSAASAPVTDDPDIEVEEAETLPSPVEPEPAPEPATISPGEAPVVQVQPAVEEVEPLREAPSEPTPTPLVAPPTQPPMERLELPGVVGPLAGTLEGALEADKTPSDVLPAPVETATPGVVLPVSESRGTREVYLAVAVGLMLLAVMILWWRFRRPRRRVHASVISRSMSRR